MNEDTKNEEKNVQKKNKFDYFVIVKWIIGVYFIGVLVSFNSYLLGLVAKVVFEGIMSSEIMTIELVPLAQILREPLIPLLVMIPFFLPSAIILLALRFVIDKFKIFTGTQRNVYMIMSIALLLLVTISTFMFS